MDLGSGGDPIAPEALGIDLPAKEAERYSTTDWGRRPIQWRGDARDLYWFQGGTLDYVYSSHLIEDFTAAEQREVLAEWGRVVKPGGYLVLLYPENRRWAAAVEAGQPMNANHQHEPDEHEIANHLREMGWTILEDRLADEQLRAYGGGPDYSWLVVAQKPEPDGPRA